MRNPVLVALLLAVLTVPAAAGQTLTNPINGSYEELYIISGRVIDSIGNPVVDATLVVEVSQRDVLAKPFRVKTNCFGDYIGSFNIGRIDGSGRVSIRMEEGQGVSVASKEAKLDPFYRRSDLSMEVDGKWGRICPGQTDAWPGRVSVTGRMVNRTDTYEIGSASYDAKPYRGGYKLRFWDEDGVNFCPPTSDGSACEPLFTDERGDFRYSYTFEGSKSPKGKFEILVDDRSFNVTIDPKTRLAVTYIEVTGQGLPRSDTPGVSPLLVLGLLVGVAGARSVLHRHRR